MTKSNPNTTYNKHFKTKNILLFKNIFFIAFLITLISAIYWQVINHDFINFDDAAYVTDNTLVKQGITPKGIREAFTTTQACNWHPITWISHMLDMKLFGMTPGMHHLMNLILHILNTLLLFLILQQMTGTIWKSAAVATLFAIHPLHVESVAWIAERKDVLSTFFWMLTMAGYIRYVRNKSLKAYSLMLFFYIIGLLSKPMLVTLPFAFLLLDFWPLKRWVRSHEEATINKIPEYSSSSKTYETVLTKLIIEKMPLFLLSLTSCFITLYVQRGAITSLNLNLITRISNAVNSYVMYLVKTIWPFDLTFFYPFYYIHPVRAILCATILCFISVYVLIMAKKFPYFFVGWFWYLGTLVPVIGIVQIGGQSMADRYTYIPLIGIFIMAVWGFADLIERLRLSRAIVWVFSAIVFILLSARTLDQIGLWKDSETICRHALKINSDNYIAHCDLAIALKKKGDIDGAVIHYKETLRLNPENCIAHNNLGALLSEIGKTDEGIQHFQTALKINPHLADTYYNLGMVYYQKGDYPKALEYFQKTLREQPNHGRAIEGINASLKNLKEAGK